jgi:hypothetical protein
MQSIQLPQLLEEVRARRQSELHTSIRPVNLILLILIGLAFAWRITNLLYNTLFVDEAMYIVVGNEISRGVYTQYALSWMFGSHFFPVVTSFMYDVGGVLAIRAFAAVLSMVAGLFVYLTARRLFGQTVGFWALLLYTLAGPSVSLGQQAVYDALALPFLAASMYYATLAALREKANAQLYYSIAGAAFALAILSKYVSIAYLPAIGVMVLGVRLHVRNAGGFLRFQSVILFFVPLVIILGPYLFYHFHEVRQTLGGQFSFQIASRNAILTELMRDIGVPLLLSFVGIAVILYQLTRTLRLRGLTRIGFLLFGALASLSLYTLPLYHLYGENIRSLWKHSVFTLLFIAIPAAVAIAAALRFLYSARGRRMPQMRLLVGALLVVGCLAFVRTALDLNGSFQQSFPNVERVVEYLRVDRPELNAQSFVMASASSVYETYLFPERPLPVNWYSTWSMFYNNNTGEPAMQMAIADCALDTIILDNYYTGGLMQTLAPYLESAGYLLDFTDEFTSFDGIVFTTQVYVPGGTGVCASRILN